MDPSRRDVKAFDTARIRVDLELEVELVLFARSRLVVDDRENRVSAPRVIEDHICAATHERVREPKLKRALGRPDPLQVLSPVGDIPVDKVSSGLLELPMRRLVCRGKKELIIE